MFGRQNYLLITANLCLCLVNNIFKYERKINIFYMKFKHEFPIKKDKKPI